MKRSEFYCDNCGGAVSLDAEICPRCGSVFDAVRCPSCSFAGSPDAFANGCPSCGYLSKPNGAGVKGRRNDPATGATSKSRDPETRGSSHERKRKNAPARPAWVYTVTAILLGVVLLVLVLVLISM